MTTKKKATKKRKPRKAAPSAQNPEPKTGAGTTYGERQTPETPEVKDSGTEPKEPEKLKSEGLGDTVEKITKATGVKKAFSWFEKVTGKDCGCEERREKLNKVLRYKRRLNCMTLSDYDRWASARSAILKEVKERGTITQGQLITVYELHKKLTGFPLEFPCPGCSGAARLWLKMVDQLEKIWTTYNVKAQKNDP